MTDTWNIDDLRWAAKYRELRDKVRLMAGLAIIVGGFTAVIFSLSLLSDDSDTVRAWDIVASMAALLVFIFAFLSFLWPKPLSLVCLAVMWVLLLFAGGVGLLVDSGGGPRPAEVTTGVAVIAGLVGLAIANIRLYPRYAKIPEGQPNMDQVKWIDQTVEGIKKAKPNEATDMIAFKADGLSWRAKLTGDIGLFVKNRKHVVLAGREEVEITPVGKSPAGKKTKARFHVADHKLKGTIRVEFLEHYEEWKRGTNSHQESIPHSTSADIA